LHCRELVGVLCRDCTTNHTMLDDIVSELWRKENVTSGYCPRYRYTLIATLTLGNLYYICVYFLPTDTAQQTILRGDSRKSWTKLYNEIIAKNSGYENFLWDSVWGTDRLPKTLNIWLDILHSSTHSTQAMRTLTQFLSYSTPKWEQYVNQYIMIL
jgi:hypothetical protein